MNIEEVYASAESKCACLGDPDGVRIWVGSLAGDAAASNVFGRIQEETAKRDLKAKVIMVGSSGYYDLEPTVLVEKPGSSSVLYNNVTPTTAKEIVEDHLVNGNSRPDLAFCSFGKVRLDSVPLASDLPLFSLQRRIALRNCGCIDPESIEHYVLRGDGYRGLARCLQMSQTEVIEEIRRSGLRGRGGGGYSTADKWRACRDAQGSEKYVVCNAVDADPQSFTARLLLESDPHSVLEGVLIAAYAVGASRCFMCVSDKSRMAVERLDKALEQMRMYGLLGDGILDSHFSTDIEIRTVTASLVAGEETALLSSLEGKQPVPFLRTTYPAIKGFQGKPTLVNNVETLSNVSAILQKGSACYSGIGVESSKGCKVVTLSGGAVHKCTVEVPFGASLRSIVTYIGGGTADGKEIKAVQFGGPTGAYFAAHLLDTRIDYESIKEAGSTMGSGTVKLFDGDSCAVEMARDVISYLQLESCGKCVFCREGSLQMADILKDLAENGGKAGDLDLLVELGEMMRTGSICDLGRAAPNPVLSSIKAFRVEYEVHAREKRCHLTAAGKSHVSGKRET